jgi:hypothetical protein
VAVKESSTSTYCRRICQEGLRKISVRTAGLRAEILSRSDERYENTSINSMNWMLRRVVSFYIVEWHDDESEGNLKETAVA